MKGSYRLSRLLKRFIPNGFGDTFLEPELSEPGRKKSEDHFTDNRQVPVLKSREPLNMKDTEPEKQRYLAYQKEVEAGKNVPEGQTPDSPGRILKLPLDE